MRLHHRVPPRRLRCRSRWPLHLAVGAPRRPPCRRAPCCLKLRWSTSCSSVAEAWPGSGRRHAPRGQQLLHHPREAAQRTYCHRPPLLHRFVRPRFAFSSPRRLFSKFWKLELFLLAALVSRLRKLGKASATVILQQPHPFHLPLCRVHVWYYIYPRRLPQDRPVDTAANASPPPSLAPYFPSPLPIIYEVASSGASSRPSLPLPLASSSRRRSPPATTLPTCSMLPQTPLVHFLLLRC